MTVGRRAVRGVFGRVDDVFVGELNPGETKTARFTLEVKKAYKNDTFPIKLAIIDEPLEEFTTEKLEIPVDDQGVSLEKSKGIYHYSVGASHTGFASGLAPMTAVGALCRLYLGSNRSNESVQLRLVYDPTTEGTDSSTFHMRRM